LILHCLARFMPPPSRRDFRTGRFGSNFSRLSAEGEALVGLWTLLTARAESGDTISVVADGYARRTG
jgi:hypothetical protein